MPRPYAPLTPAAEAQHDSVESPSHYRSHPSGIECIQITEHMDFLIGNAVKYLWRAGLKSVPLGDSEITPHVEDLKKSIWYINRKIANLEAQRRQTSLDFRPPHPTHPAQARNDHFHEPNVGAGAGIGVRGEYTPEPASPPLAESVWRGPTLTPATSTAQPVPPLSPRRP
jgi:hypothetical protein